MVSTIARTTVLGNTAEEQKAIQLIKELDLEPIVYKLTRPAHGKPPEMTLEEADAGVALYRQFLILNVLCPEQALVPTLALDEVWHAHVLDTAKYAEDCQLIFGRMLHHFPYLGLRGPQDVENWQRAAAETRALFQQYFGTEIMATGECGASGCMECSSQITDTWRPRPVRN